MSVERMAAFMPVAWRNRVASCGGRSFDEDGLAVCLTGVPMAAFNPTLVERLPSDPDAALAAAEARYEGTGLSFGIDLEATLHQEVRFAAQRAGLELEEERPGMVLNAPDLQVAPVPEGVEIVRVTETALLDELVQVDAEAFGGDADMTRGFVPDAVLDDPSQRAYLARVDGRWVAAGETSVVDGVMGVFGIATVPEYRRRGIGAALTSFAIQDRLDQIDMAVLDASDMGFGVYERLGFRTNSSWEVWVRKDGSAAA